MIKTVSSRSLRSEVSMCDSSAQSSRLQRRASIKSTSQFSAQADEREFLREQIEEEQRHRAALIRMFGFPEAPSQVLALGKDGCAAVWWHHDDYFREREERIQRAQAEQMNSSEAQGSSPHKAEGADTHGRDWAEAEDTEADLATDELVITHWEVHRYRRDKVPSKKGSVGDGSSSSSSRKLNQSSLGGLESQGPIGEWKYKGFTRFDALLLEGQTNHQAVPQVLIAQLTNDYEYKFTVKAVNAKGSSAESSSSNPVMVEAPLPSGWNRFFDNFTGRHYYANIRTQMSSWSRPELDPYFLDEAVVSNFSSRELRHLRSLFEEEMAHFQCVSVSRYLDVLRECGERATKWWVAKLFRGFVQSSGANSNAQQILQGGATAAAATAAAINHPVIGSSQQVMAIDSDVVITSWQHFMEVTNHIKEYRSGGRGRINEKAFKGIIMYLTRLVQV